MIANGQRSNNNQRGATPAQKRKIMKIRCVNKRCYTYTNKKLNKTIYEFDRFRPTDIQEILEIDRKIGIKSRAYRLGKYLIIETII